MYTYRPIKKGTTDVTVYVRVIDSSDGTPETGVAYNTTGIDLWYMREGADHVAITEATQTAAGAHSDGGFVHISDGWCRLDLPDAACASGVDGVMVGGTITGMIVLGCMVPLVDYDPYDTVRLGLTAMPNAAADAAGGLPISDAGGLDMDAIPTAITALNDPTAQAIVDELMAETIDGTVTYKTLVQAMASVLAGKVTGGGTTTITFRDLADTLNRVAATVDSSGNRSAVTITADA